MGVFDFLPGRGGDDEADEASSSGDSTTGGGEAGEPERLADPGPADFRERAEALTRRSDVPTLDFTVDSLERLDELAAGPASAVDDRVAYGSYLGETIVRAYDGEWVAVDGWQVAVAVPDDRTTVAVFDAAEMSIAADPVFAKVVAHLEAQGAERTTDAGDESTESEAERDESTEAGDGSEGDDEEPAGELEGDESDTDRDAVADADTVVVDADAGGDDGTNDGRASGDEERDDGPDESHLPDERQTPVEDDAASGSVGESFAAEREEVPEGTDDDNASVAPFADEDEEEDETSDETDGEGAAADDSSEEEPRDPKVVSVYEDADASGDDSETAAGAVDESTPSRDVDGETDGNATRDDNEGLTEASADGADEPAVPDRSVLRAAAAELAEGWPSRDLDFTPGSLPRLDTFVDEQWEGRFRARSLADRDVDHESNRDPLVQIGAYYGEVLLRWLDGEWVATEDGEGAVAVPDVGERVEQVDVFQIARECLIPPSTFAYRYDALVNRLSVDEVPVSHGRADVFDGDRDSLTSGDVITQFAATAETFVERWPEYPLDYTPRSVRALDEIAEQLTDDVDATGASLADGTDPRSLWLTARATSLGAYYAAVLLRHRDGQWRIDGDVELVVDRTAGERTVDPVRTAADCLRGEGSFVETYASLDD